MIEYRENDNIDYESRKKYESMSDEELERLMLEMEKEALKKMGKIEST